MRVATMPPRSAEGRPGQGPADGPPAQGRGPAGHYEVLGVPREASFPEIRAAFKRRALEVHPDKSGGNEAAFVAVFQALEILQDDIKRKSYDAELSHSVSQLQPPQPSTGKRKAEACTHFGSQEVESPEGEIFSLLQQLPMVERREVLQEMSTAQRKALEAWADTHRATARVSPASFAAPSKDKGCGDWSESPIINVPPLPFGVQTSKLALEDFSGSAAALEADTEKNAHKGITTLYKGATPMYTAGVHFENISITGRTVKNLDVALDDWVFLSGVKRDTLASSAEPLGVRLRRAFQRAFDHENKEEDDLGLSYVIRLKQSFWVGRRNISTPRLKSVEQCVRAWEHLDPHCIHSAGAAGHVWRWSLEELQDKWNGFKHAFADVCEEAGSSRHAVLEKLENWEQGNKAHREQLVQRWDSQRQRQEALLSARVKRESDCAARGEAKKLGQVRCAIARWSKSAVREANGLSMQSHSKITPQSTRST